MRRLERGWAMPHLQHDWMSDPIVAALLSW